jgi:hypothetical protein
MRVWVHRRSSRVSPVIRARALLVWAVHRLGYRFLMVQRPASRQRPRPRRRSRRLSKGVYANYFEVGHTAFEFILDFGQTYAAKDACCHTRIVTSPAYARALLQTLTEAVDEYSRRFGEEG